MSLEITDPHILKLPWVVLMPVCPKGPSQASEKMDVSLLSLWKAQSWVDLSHGVQSSDEAHR